MNKRTASMMIATLSLVGLLVLAIAVAGCTDTAQKTTPATPAQAKTVVATTQAPVSTTAAAGTPAQKQSIKISGSTTVLPIVQKAADQYMTAHPEADIQVSSGGSGVGIQAIGGKTVDIGMSSRELKPEEKTRYPGLVKHVVAKDGIAIIVNPKNEIRFITLDQVKGIYTGQITKWTEITGAHVLNTNNQIVVFGRDSASGTREYFNEVILNKASSTPKMLETNSNGALAQNIAQTPGAIGYISIGFVSNDVKALPIRYSGDTIVEPSNVNVLAGTYPISRELYVFTNGEATGLAKDFIDYIKGPEGQKIVADEGYVSIR